MSMSMTPDQFYLAFVMRNYEEFEEHVHNYKDLEDYPDCIRKAFNAIVSASHMADHYFTFFKRNQPSKVTNYETIGKYVEHVTQKTDGCFKDIRSIANAYKHLYTGNDPKYAKYSTVSSMGIVDMIPIKSKDVVEISQESLNDGAIHRFAVIYTKQNGQRFELLPALKKVIDFWEQEIDYTWA